MDCQQSGKGRRERRCRASISGPMRPHAPSAFQGGPCRPGSPPASSAFAVLVARYFSPLRTFKQRLTATASLPSASRNRADSQSRQTRSARRCRPPAANRQRADTGCNASLLSQPHHPLSAHKCQHRHNHQKRDDTVSRSTVWCCSHDHAAAVAPQPPPATCRREH